MISGYAHWLATSPILEPFPEKRLCELTANDYACFFELAGEEPWERHTWSRDM